MIYVRAEQLIRMVGCIMFSGVWLIVYSPWSMGYGGGGLKSKILSLRSAA